MFLNILFTLVELKLVSYSLLLSAPTTIDCRGTVVHVTTPGTIIQSPNYPKDYMNYQDCKAVVRFTQRQKVFVEFIAFSVELSRYGYNCKYDWLEIRDGKDSSANLLAKKCGYQLPPPIYSTGNTLYLHFHTDGSRTRSGFQLRVKYPPGMHHFLE